MVLRVEESMTLEPIAPKPAAELYHAVDKNRAHLSEFLTWVDFLNGTGDFHLTKQFSKSASAPNMIVLEANSIRFPLPLYILITNYLYFWPGCIRKMLSGYFQ